MSDTGCGRLISVLAFYVFSCSCFHGSQARKPSREARNESQFLWREEIESGPIPSFVRNNNSRQSSGGSSRMSPHDNSTPSCSKTTSQLSLSFTLGTESQPLENLVSPAEKQKTQRITTVTISELPKIHPPINDRHPPVVSALPETRTAMAWMMLPPPPARVMKAINRAAHIRKSSQRDGTDNPLSNATPSSSTAAAATTREIEQGSGWGRYHRADSVVPNTTRTTVLSKPTKERPHDIPSCPTFTGVGYEWRFFDPTTGGIKTHALPYSEGILYRAPPPSAATFVEVIQRPPPVLKSRFPPTQSLDGFEDIYG